MKTCFPYRSKEINKETYIHKTINNHEISSEERLVIFSIKLYVLAWFSSYTIAFSFCRLYCLFFTRTSFSFLCTRFSLFAGFAERFICFIDNKLFLSINLSPAPKGYFAVIKNEFADQSGYLLSLV